MCIPALLLGEPDGLLHEDWPISPKSSCLPSNLHLERWIWIEQTGLAFCWRVRHLSFLTALIPNPLEIAKGLMLLADFLM